MRKSDAFIRDAAIAVWFEACRSVRDVREISSRPRERRRFYGAIRYVLRSPRLGDKRIGQIVRQLPPRQLRPPLPPPTFKMVLHA